MHLVDSFGHEQAMSHLLDLYAVSDCIYIFLLTINLFHFLYALIQFWSYPSQPGLTYPVGQRQSDLSS